MHGAKPKPKAVNLADLITKGTAAKLRGIQPASFTELLERYPDRLHTYEIGGVQFVFRSEVLALKTQRQRKGTRAA